MLKRERYLEKIRPFYNEDLIKVIIGIRRSGKSKLLEQIKSELLNDGVNSENIIYINFELLDFAHIKDEMDLFKFVKGKINNEDKYYMFFDEIQNVKNFEKAINSFKAGLNCSIFVTGSNAKLLSGEFATLLSGRYVEFKIMPFSYNEVVEYRKLQGKDSDKSIFIDYLNWGGMPQRFSFKGESETRAYLNDLYNSIVLKDIMQRSTSSDPNLLNRIIEYMVSNTSQTFSANSIVNYLKSQGMNVGNDTIYKYVDDVLSALILDKVKRYDIKGKKQLALYEKYYVADLGLRKVKLSSLSIDLGDSLETVVYNELISRGYEVFIGKTVKGEIDFIATKDGQKFYFQVAYLLASESTIEREFGAYKGIKDNYPKFVISMDEFDFSRDGIKHLNVMQFLLNEELVK